MRRTTGSFTVGAWDVHPTLRRIAKDGVETTLNPRTMDVLVYLGERAGQPVTYEELLATFWRGSISSPNQVHKCVAELRKAFANGEDGADYIETVPRRGYRLTAQVRPATAPNQEGSCAAHLISLDQRSAVVLLGDRTDSTAREALERMCIARVGQHRDMSFRSLALATAADGADFARSIEADYLVRLDVEPSQEKLNASIVITPTAADLPSHHQQFCRVASDRLSLIEEVASAAVAALRVLLSDRRLAEMRELGTRNVITYQHLADALALHRDQSRISMSQSEPLLREAIDHDPMCARAYVALAEVLQDLGRIAPNDAEREDARRKLQALSREARLRLDDVDAVDLIERLAKLMSAANAFDLEALWSRTLRSEPTNVVALRRYGGLLVGARLFDESEAYLRRALALEPECSDWLELDEPTIWGARGDLEKYLELSKRSLDRFPDETLVLYGVVRVLGFLKRFTEAEMYLNRLEASDSVWGGFGRLTLMAFRAEIPPGSNALVHALAEAPSNTARAHISLMVGDVEGGIRYLRDMEPAFAPLVWQFGRWDEHFFAPGVREDPRYQALLDELGCGRRWIAHMRRSAAELAPITGIPLTTPV